VAVVASLASAHATAANVSAAVAVLAAELASNQAAAQLEVAMLSAGKDNLEARVESLTDDLRTKADEVRLDALTDELRTKAEP
jgi:C4-dicarboxylate-specific signal transduction histidine kinase